MNNVIEEIMNDHNDRGNEWYGQYNYHDSEYLVLEDDQDTTWVYDDETKTMTRSLIYWSPNHEQYVSITEQREFADDGDWLYFPPVIELVEKSSAQLNGIETIWTVIQTNDDQIGDEM